MLDRLERKHVRALNLLLVVLFGVSSGYLLVSTFGLYLRRQAIAPVISASRNQASTRQATLQAYQPILQNNLFDPHGRNVSRPEKLEGPSGKIPENSPKRNGMLLMGTVISKKRPFAVIQIGGNVEIFHLNEETPGGGRLEEIRREEIRIRDRDGALFTLTYPATTAVAPLPRSAVPNRPSQGIREVGEKRWIISGEQARKVLENIGEVFKHARVEARQINGRIEGYAIKMIRPRTFLSNLGLKRGDIIKEINGIQLDSDEKALQVFQQLKDARNISVVLQRRGQNLTFEYEVD